jgi:calcineurin-like phosphoesterase family protein
MKKFFYKPIIFSGKDSDFLFWCCMHMYHDPNWDFPIWKLRGFDNYADHARTLIKNWNEKANDSTVGFLLGDNVFGHDAEQKMIDILDSMIFKELYIMPGNHYSGWHQLFEKQKENEYVTNNGKSVFFIPNYIEAKINGVPIVMSHYPIISWNGMSKGSWHLYGHVHGSLSKSEIGKIYTASNFSQEVSVEIFKFPPNISDIRNAMKNKKISQIDHHDDSTKNPF